MIWIIAVLVLVLIGILLDREIYFYEGVRLGPGVQAWLYNHWSKKYDTGKRESQLHDDEMLAGPLLDMLKAAVTSEPFVLDFATGTGRLSYALTNRPEFMGRIIALDLSQGMLEQAAAKLASSAGQRGFDMGQEDPAPTQPPGATPSSAPSVSARWARVELLRQSSLPIPFPDASFDVVCALEVLELFPNMDEPLREFTRVLRPGGILLATRGTEESGRKAKVKSEQQLTSLLEKNGLENIQITKWWKLFDRVLATKKGSLLPAGVHRLSEVIRCPECGQIRWQQEAEALKCQKCGKELSITQEGIVLN